MIGPFSAAQRRALTQLAKLWSARHEFVLIGAAALHCHRATTRATQDLDLALAVAIEDFPAGLDHLPGWTRHRSRWHEWHGPEGVHIDVLPAGPRALAQGHLEWPPGVRMNLAGMKHAFDRAHPLPIDAETTIPLAPLDVLALLKIVAYLDRPDEREHDLQDLGFIMDEYVAADDERRWEDEIVARQIEFSRVGAFVLGRDLARFIAPDERAVIMKFLDVLRSEHQAGASLMARVAPPSWQRSEQEVLAQLQSLEHGLSPAKQPSP